MVQIHYYLLIKMYILETDLNEKKSIHISLTSVYGINTHLSKKICKLLGLCKNLKLKDLNKEQKNALIYVVLYLNLKINNDLKKFIHLNNKKLINLKNYKGFRRIKKLPLRGQRTRNNAKTCKKTR